MDQHGQQTWRGATALAEDETPLRVPKTAELVAAHLREQIVSGALVPGEHLPPEAALTDAFNIARPTLREAMRILESEGLLAIQRGARTGARVLRPGLAPLARHAAMCLRADRVTLGDIRRARLLIELAAVQAACARADRAVIVALHRPLADARRALAAGQCADAEARLTDFSAMLTGAADNRALTLLLALVDRLIAAQPPEPPPADMTDQPARLMASLRAAERLLALIVIGDPVQAVDHWRDHRGTDVAEAQTNGRSAQVVTWPAGR